MSYSLDLLFPTAVYKNNIGKVSEEQLAYVKSQTYTKRTTGTHGRDSTDVLELDIFKNVKDAILQNLMFVSSEIFKYDVEVYITHSWLNHNPVGSHHNSHRHSNSVFSGAYYINVPRGSPDLVFSSSVQPYLEIVPRDYTIVNSTAWTMPVSCGDLVIFPSNLLHEVPENYANSERYTLSFNTFIRGEIGARGSDNHLILK